MSVLLRNITIALASFFLLMGVLGLFKMPKAPEIIGMEKVAEFIESEELAKIAIEGDTLHLFFKSGEEKTALKESAESFSSFLKNYGVNPLKFKKVAIEIQHDSLVKTLLSSVFPFILPLLIIGGFLFFMMRQVQGANNRALMFGQVRSREPFKNAEQKKVTFEDVAGAKEAKEELKEVVEFLMNPKKFIALGAKIPKGVLLMGSPGTGKTLLAKAVAGEADVPFFSISGSEFVEMFVGVGAARVRDLFRRAKVNTPCIIFVDELDAVGRQRGAGLGGSHDEREQTLNQILVEMDGFDPNSGIIVLGATNRPDILDPALLRPGRFDRRVILDEPDLKDREAILKIHSRGKPIASTVDLKKIAQRTPGFSGADLANLMNEAAILAARRAKIQIQEEELISSIEKVMLGPERQSHILNEKERKITAYHEGGHALVAHESKGADQVRKVSIIARGVAAGYTLKLPSDDKHLRSFSEFKAELAVLVAGHVTEKEIFGEVTTGAANDLKEATRIAKKMITEYGMSEGLGPRTFGQKEELIFLGREITEQRDFSEEIAQRIDQEVSRLIKEAVIEARAILKEKRAILECLVEVLLKKETIEQEEFESLFRESGV
jgi:cell division protease FtsH